MAFTVYIVEPGGTQHTLTNYVIGKAPLVYDAEPAPFDFFTVNGFTIAFDTRGISYEPQNDDFMIVFQGTTVINSGYLRNKKSYFKSPIIKFDVVNEVEILKAESIPTNLTVQSIKGRLQAYTDITNVIGLDATAQSYVDYASFDTWSYTSGSTANDLIFDCMLVLHAHYSAKSFLLNKKMYVAKEVATTTLTAAEIIELEQNSESLYSTVSDYQTWQDHAKGTGNFSPTWSLPPKPQAYDTIEYNLNTLYSTTDIEIGSDVFYNGTNYGYVIAKDMSNSVIKYTLKKIIQYYVS